MDVQRIVENGLKCDFHIHSSYSAYFEKGQIKSVVAKNNDISLLKQKLNDNEIEFAAITDHNVFSFDTFQL